MKLPENVTVYEGGRRHRGEIPDATAERIAAVEEKESSRKGDPKKQATLSGAITKAQSILDKQKKKSEKKSEPAKPETPEKK